MRVLVKAVVVAFLLGSLPVSTWGASNSNCPSVPVAYHAAAAAGEQTAASLEARGEFLAAYDTRLEAARDQRIADSIESTRAKYGCT